jgi:hypothetical protein
VRGVVHYAVDPKNPHDRLICDVDKAATNARGEVEFSGDVDILRPKEPGRGNGVLYVNVPNRGLRFFVRDKNVDEWYLRQGFTLAEVAWQFDVRPDAALLHFTAPVAKGVSGHVRSDFVVAERRPTHTIAHEIQGAIGGTGYPVSDRKDAVLTERDEPLAPRRTIPRKSWRFTDDRTIALDGGFAPGKVYEIVYTASDPALVGTGLAAIRDFASYAKHDPDAIVKAKSVYAMGISQNGRFLRHFLWQGFNADESGRQALDAVLAYVAGAGRGNFNHRFAQPSRDAQPLTPAFYPVDVPPFTDGELLEKARAESVVPKLFLVNTEYEYWSRAASLTHTTPDGARDVAPTESTRIYLVAGLAHVAGPFPPEKPAAGQELENPLSITAYRRGFTAALDAWAREGVEPPASRIPRIADGTLVPASKLALPSMHGVAPPRFAYPAYKIADGNTEPPVVTGTYTTLVPQVGPDGNALAGVRPPELGIPLATYTGWNLRAPSTGFPEYRASFIGSFIPFPKAEVLERNRDADTYLGRFARAAAKLVRERFLVADDLPAILARAEEEWALAVK